MLLRREGLLVRPEVRLQAAEALDARRRVRLAGARTGDAVPKASRCGLFVGRYESLDCLCDRMLCNCRRECSCELAALRDDDTT